MVRRLTTNTRTIAKVSLNVNTNSPHYTSATPTHNTNTFRGIVNRVVPTKGRPPAPASTSNLLTVTRPRNVDTTLNTNRISNLTNSQNGHTSRQNTTRISIQHNSHTIVHRDRISHRHNITTTSITPRTSVTGTRTKAVVPTPNGTRNFTMSPHYSITTSDHTWGGQRDLKRRTTRRPRHISSTVTNRVRNGTTIRQMTNKVINMRHMISSITNQTTRTTLTKNSNNMGVIINKRRQRREANTTRPNIRTQATLRHNTRHSQARQARHSQHNTSRQTRHPRQAQRTRHRRHTRAPSR